MNGELEQLHTARRREKKKGYVWYQKHRAMNAFFMLVSFYHSKHDKSASGQMHFCLVITLHMYRCYKYLLFCDAGKMRRKIMNNTNESALTSKMSATIDQLRLRATSPMKSMRKAK